MSNGNGKETTDLQTIEEPTALAAITQGEVDVQVATAKRYPRTISKFLKDAESLATIDRATADSCMYALPRGGKLIPGPSIRLAEIIAGTWGNLRIDVRILDEGRTHVVAQATAWDMEANVLVRQESRRRITDKSGNRYKSDMIIMTGNAAISIAMRNAIFRVVPRSLVNRLYNAARVVAVGEARTMFERRDSMLKTFTKLGVSEERILASIDCEAVEDIDADALVKLLGVFNAIRDGGLSPDVAFPPVASDAPANPKRGTDAVLDALNAPDAGPQATPATQPAPEDQAPPDPPSEGLDGPQTGAACGDTQEPMTPLKELRGLGELLGLPEDVVEDILATEKVSHRSKVAGQPYIRARAAIEAEGKRLRKKG